MKSWPDKLRLLVILAATRTLVAKSKHEGWPDEKPEEVRKDLDQIIDAVFYKHGGPLPKYWNILFAPTGPVQEISLSNGWAETFLKLAEEFDSCEHILKAYEAKQGGPANRSQPVGPQTNRTPPAAGSGG